MALNMYFEKEELDTDEDHREFTEAALNQYTFLFSEVTKTPNGDVSCDNVNVLLLIVFLDKTEEDLPGTVSSSNFHHLPLCHS